MGTENSDLGLYAGCSRMRELVVNCISTLQGVTSGSSVIQLRNELACLSLHRKRRRLSDYIKDMVSESRLLGPVQKNQCRPMDKWSVDLREQDEFEMVIEYSWLE